jgi:two-component system sensor histidine kinase BaeS
VLAFVAVAILAAVLIGVITLSLIRLVPERGLEQQLADQAQAVSETFAGRRPLVRLCALVRVLRRGETEVYLLDSTAAPSRPVPCQGVNRRSPIAPAPEANLTAALAQGEIVTGTSHGLAWAVVPGERPAGVRGVLLVHQVRGLGLSLLPVVAWRLLLATALAVAAAALAAWLLAGRLTAPLARLVAAARRVGDGDLSTRVQVDGDGEVAEVAAAFNDMAAGLERAQGEQRAFLASVGHELKTPLTTVQGYTEALLDGTVDDPAEQRRSLVRVHAETIRLARLVQDLLDLARLGRGQFAVSAVDADVGVVLRQAAAAAAERAGRRQVTVATRLAGPLYAYVDPGRLRQVLDNLLDNAGRSSPPAVRSWSPPAPWTAAGSRRPSSTRGPASPPRTSRTPSTAATCGPATAAPARSGRASAWPSSRPSATPWPLTIPGRVRQRRLAPLPSHPSPGPRSTDRPRPAGSRAPRAHAAHPPPGLSRLDMVGRFGGGGQPAGRWLARQGWRCAV